MDDKVAGGLPYYMRTPETTIGLDEWDEKVDIWTFGALVSSSLRFGGTYTMSLFNGTIWPREAPS